MAGFSTAIDSRVDFGEELAEIGILGDVEPAFVPDGMTLAELVRWQKKAHMAFYLRPRIIFQHLFLHRTMDWRDAMAGFRLIVAPTSAA